MTSLVVLSLLASVPLPPECEPPPLHDVAPLKTFAQKSGTLSVGLDSVATWCFDSAGAWTGGVRPEPGKKPKPLDPNAAAVGDCARALASCDEAKLALSDDLTKALAEAQGDLERPFRGQKYVPKRSGLNERPSTAVNCKERSRPDLFAQAQARMDLARLASTVQNEYANYRTWLFSRGLECAQQVRSGKVDNTRVAVAVDAEGKPVPQGAAGGVLVNATGVATGAKVTGTTGGAGGVVGGVSGAGVATTAGPANAAGTSAGVVGANAGAAGAGAVGVGGAAVGGTGTAGVTVGGTNPGGTRGGSAGVGVGGAGVGTGVAGTNVGGTNVGGTNAGGTNVGGTNAGGTNVGGTNVAGTNVGGTNVGGTNAGVTSVGGTNIAGTNVAGTTVGGTNVAGTNAGGTNVGGTTVGGTNVAGTNAGGTNVGGTNIAETNIGGTNAAGTTVGGPTVAGTNVGGTNVAGTTPGGARGGSAGVSGGTPGPGARVEGGATGSSAGADAALPSATGAFLASVTSQPPSGAPPSTLDSMLETWRGLAERRGKMELDRDYTLGFLASRELRDCRCQRSSPAGIVNRLEQGDGLAQLEADHQRAVACEHCLQNAFAAWRVRAQKQCALMNDLSPYELDVLQRSDDGNGLPPRCVQEAVARRGLDAGVIVAAPTPAAPVKPSPPTAVAQPPAPTPSAAAPVQPTGMPRFEPPSPLADGFFRPSEPAPMPLREEGRFYVRVFMSSTCAADVLPGPILARTGDLLLLPYGARQLSLRSPCGGLAEVYWGKEPMPRFSEVFGRNQPLHFQFKQQ